MKLNSVEPEVLYHRKMLGFLEHDVPAAQKEVDSLINNKNQLTLNLRHSELTISELSLKLEELEEKGNSRERELQDLEKERSHIK